LPRYYAQVADREVSFDISETANGVVVQSAELSMDGAGSKVDLAPVHFNQSTGEGLYSLLVDGLSYQLYVERMDVGYRVALWRHRFSVTVMSEREWRLQKVAPKPASISGKLLIPAPMPGLVKLVVAAEGDQVERGQRLVVLEAMKMENDITAPREGVVATIHVEAGSVVESGRPLVTLE
jgi:biotin carboxyl carrier protein